MAIRSRTALYEQALPSGERLILLQLSTKMLEREEVFMGSVLFGDWLRKSFVRAVEAGGLGPILPVTNDLEASYFLLMTRATVAELAGALRSHVAGHVAELFLGDPDPQRGLHGSFAGMFSIPKSDFEPFPIFAMPRFLLRDLERRMREVVRGFIDRPFVRMRVVQKGKEETGVSLDYRLVQANMAFFYGRTSGGIGDSQSHNTFMARLATEYGVVTAQELADAYRLSSDVCPGPASLDANQRRQAYKDAIDEAVKEHSFDEDKLRALLGRVLDTFAANIEGQPEGSDEPEAGESYLRSWFLPYIRSSHKAIEIMPEAYVDALLHRVTLGPETLALVPVEAGWACRTCGDQQALVPEKNILLGIAVGKFYNQLPNQPQSSSRRICVRCALYSYLGTKLFGATTSGKFPVPKQDNLIFHYGRHSAEAVGQLRRRLDSVLDAVKKVNDERIKALIARENAQEQVVFDKQRELEVLERALDEKRAAGESISDDERRARRRLARELGSEELRGIQELLRQAAACEVIDLGFGEERLMAFALPRMKDDLELADKRFVRARLTVYALIAFLQDACGCDGPYFFRTLPRIGEGQDSNARGHFYVQEQSISAEEYRRRYQAAASFAWRVTKGRGKDALTRWLGLSEDLSAEPLETFAQVLRDSPLHAGDSMNDARYRVLSNKEGNVVFDHDLNVWDGWAYLRAYSSLHELWQRGDQL